MLNLDETYNNIKYVCDEESMCNKSYINSTKQNKKKLYKFYQKKCPKNKMNNTNNFDD